MNATNLLDQSADAASKLWEMSRSYPPQGGQRPKIPFTASMFPSCQATSSQLTVGRSRAGKSFHFQAGLQPGTLCFPVMVLGHPTMPACLKLTRHTERRKYKKTTENNRKPCTATCECVQAIRGRKTCTRFPALHFRSKFKFLSP